MDEIKSAIISNYELKHLAKNMYLFNMRLLFTFYGGGLTIRRATASPMPMIINRILKANIDRSKYSAIAARYDYFFDLLPVLMSAEYADPLLVGSIDDVIRGEPNV